MVQEKAEKPATGKLVLAMARIEKAHGQGTVSRGGGIIANVESHPTGVALVDLALGCAGLPRGRIIEVFGPESSGKTTLALTTAASFQSKPGVVAYVDVEHALDPQWATQIGVNMSDLILSQPDSAEQALDVVIKLAETGEVDLIVLDSVASLVPQAELDGEVGDSFIGLQARLMSQTMRKIKGVLSASGCTALFINQIREKIGVMYGSNETTPGGRALKFYASVRIDVRRKDAIKVGDRTVGFKAAAKIVKNKVGPPFTKAEYDTYWGYKDVWGIDTFSSLIEAASAAKVLTRSSSWFYYGDEKFLGLEKLIEHLRQNPQGIPGLKEKTYTVLRSNRAAVPILDVPDEELAANVVGGDGGFDGGDNE